MKPLFMDIIGTDKRKYHININQILYFYSYDHKGDMITEIVFTNKESIESEETPAELERRIHALSDQKIQQYH